jgi:hypothetical protein
MEARDATVGRRSSPVLTEDQMKATDAVVAIFADHQAAGNAVENRQLPALR